MCTYIHARVHIHTYKHIHTREKESKRAHRRTAEDGEMSGKWSLYKGSFCRGVKEIKNLLLSRLRLEHDPV